MTEADDTLDDAEDFVESLAITHHLAILDLIEVIRGIEGAPGDQLDKIRDVLVDMLPPEDIEPLQ